MTWRAIMGDKNFNGYAQKEQKEQKPPTNPPFATIATIADRGQELKPEKPDGITRRLMDSRVLGGIVPISWTPGGETVFVDGIPYTGKEISELVARHPDAATMRTVHEVKRAFQATVN